MRLETSKRMKTMGIFVSASVSRLVIIGLTVLLIGPLSIMHGTVVLAKDSSYIPAAPSGPTAGLTTIDYDYAISTTNPDAHWMFDWGDGTYSDWVSLIGSEDYVVQSHNWSSPGIYNVRVNYRSPYFEEIWSPSLEVNITEPNETDLPNKPAAPLGETAGITNMSYSYSTYATDNNGDNVQYRFDWGDGTVSNWTSLVASGSSSHRAHAWTYAGTYAVKAQARDAYGLRSNWSDPLNVSIEKDSDGDGLSDRTEATLGSNSSDPVDVFGIVIGDVTHYIVTISGGDLVLFYNTTGEQISALGYHNDDILIDDNCDGKWDYIYDVVSGIAPYQERSEEESPFEFFWLWVIIGIIIAVIIIILVLFKKGYIYFYEEYVTEE